MANFIFYFLSALYGATIKTLDVNLTNWQFWVILMCVIGAYFCGVARNK